MTSAGASASPRQRAWRRFAANRGALVGGAIALALIALAIVGPYLTGDPHAPDIDHGLSALGAPLGPRAGAWLGSHMAISKGSAFLRGFFLVVLVALIGRFGWDILRA